MRKCGLVASQVSIMSDLIPPGILPPDDGTCWSSNCNKPRLGQRVNVISPLFLG